MTIHELFESKHHAHIADEENELLNVKCITLFQMFNR